MNATQIKATHIDANDIRFSISDDGILAETNGKWEALDTIPLSILKTLRLLYQNHDTFNLKLNNRQLKKVIGVKEKKIDELSHELQLMRGSFISAIEFSLSHDEGLSFLRLWMEGDFDACREWDSVPTEVFYPEIFTDEYQQPI